MPGERRLWTGPYGSSLRDGALRAAPVEPSGLWITPTPLARDQARRLLGLRAGEGVGPGLRVWCWSDLWRAIHDERPQGPALLSDAAARATLGAAIGQARAEGQLDALADMLEWPGFRRRLRARIAAWTRDERPPEAGPGGDDALLIGQWAIFARYRALLKALDAEDDAGLAVWASRSLVQDPPREFRRLGAVTFLDLEDDSRAVWRVLEFAHERANSVQVTMAYDSAEELAEVYASHAPIRRRLLDWSFVETRETPELFRPRGLAGVEHELFRVEAHRRPALESSDGLAVIGAPQGEACALVIAREVADRLESGADPEDVLVLFRRWDDHAALVLETCRAWGLPVAAEVRRQLAHDPALSALRLAMKLPVEDWEATAIVRLLRHGQVRPDWPEARPPRSLAIAASVVHNSRVFRGRDALRRALDRAMTEERTAQDAKPGRAMLARDVVERLIGLIDPLNRPAPWREQAGKLRGLAEGLRLGSDSDCDSATALEYLWSALDDHAMVLEALGSARRVWSWPDFTREVEALVGEVEIPAHAAGEGIVRLATVDEAAGARADCLLVGNLDEGTFPVREAVAAELERTPNAEPSRKDQADLAFAREMLRFLRVVGSAESRLVLVHPTTDAQGQELLKAGFLDDLLRRFSPAAADRFVTEYARFDPALVGQPDLARAPADARVRAVALACNEQDPEALATLARSPIHRPVLDGTASALRVAQRRTRARDFGPFDGRLGDPRVWQRLNARYGPDYCFSPSQIESYVYCPFQFYLRYVLKLVPVDDRDELEEDYTERGSKIHRLLELLEQFHALEGPEADRLTLAAILIEREMMQEPPDGPSVDAGLRQIEQRRLKRAIDRYVRQYQLYEGLIPESRPVPRHFEVNFGHEESDSRSRPSLNLGDGNEVVRLQGKIDRIDLLPAPGETAFRIIDYKTGARPSKKDVKESLYLQLPLYAMAVERLVLAAEDGRARLCDVGYWGLSGDGYKPITLKEWEADQARLEGHVIALVNHIRHGVFPIDPRKDDCTHRCEFHTVCRIRQVRASGKRREDVLRLELKIR